MFVGQAGKGRICYTLAQPKTREPDSLKRDPGYAFISDRPAEGVRNEVSFIMGFDVAGGTEAETNAEFKPEGNAATKPGAKTDAKKDVKSKHSKAEAKAKPIAAPVATVGEESFDLLPKGGDLWVKNAARESALIAEMKKGVTLEVRAASIKGNEFDRFLFALRLLPGDGAPAEGMSGQVSLAEATLFRQAQKASALGKFVSDWLRHFRAGRKIALGSRVQAPARV